jgi:DNA-binding transcriptional MerR regulator
MMSKRRGETEPVLWRIGEVAKLTGVTTRTLRYWEELGLLRPSNHSPSGERLYVATDLARVTRIRKLQGLLGLSLAEIQAVLGTEAVDVLDRVHSEIDAVGLSPSRRKELLDEGIVPTTSSWPAWTKRCPASRRFVASGRRSPFDSESPGPSLMRMPGLEPVAGVPPLGAN